MRYAAAVPPGPRGTKETAVEHQDGPKEIDVVMIINPGSRIGEPGDGWTNTFEEARAEAGRWLTRMHASGMTDVQLLDGAHPDADMEGDGRWVFTFRHTVTGVTAELATHGIDDTAAYERQHIFAPRVYWNGSSTAEPELENFAAPGFALVRTFKTQPEEAGDDQPPA